MRSGGTAARDARAPTRGRRPRGSRSLGTVGRRRGPAAIGGAVAAVVLLCAALAAAAVPARRFTIEGDGTVALLNPKTGAGGLVTYRTRAGTYPTAAQRRINRIFGVPPDASAGMAPRLIALLDYVQDHFRGATIRIVSGYRSPAHNERLRLQGGLVARTSLHLEGMAADIEVAGVPGRRLWMFVRSLQCCGAGYYHGRSVHVDVGPRRFWDETSTGVEQDLGARNRLLLLRTEWDVYRPGETVRMTVARITDYPIEVRRAAQLVRPGGATEEIRLDAAGPCVAIHGREAARGLAWTISPRPASPGTVRVRLSFCRRSYPEMPGAIESNPIIIR